MARAVSLEIGLNAPMTGLHAGSSEIRHIYTPLSPVYCLQENPVVTFSLSCTPLAISPGQAGG